ncbi:MAG: hypothetical protein ACI4R8_02035 [Candidatus Caccovivens sp.]
MDKLVVETEVEKKENVEQKRTRVEPIKSTFVKSSAQKIQVTLSKEPQIQTEYLNSLENLTIADVKKTENEKQVKEFKVQKEELIQDQFKEVQNAKQQGSQNIVEKPNYDLIDKPKRVIRLNKKTQEKKKPSKKAVGIALACALGISGVICVTNTIIIDNMSSNFLQIDETYKLNLAKYIKNITNLDTTKKSMEFLESYPDENLEAGDLGEKTNWFDQLCNFISGIFGG